MELLFIGNSHTYVNDVPLIVKEIFASVNVSTHPVMMTEGGVGIIRHCNRSETCFNITYGEYNTVVMQDKASNFDAEKFLTGMQTIDELALSNCTSKRVLYMPWANKDTPEKQPYMTDAYMMAKKRHNCILAPVGELWHKLLRDDPKLPLYQPDGNHATKLGSYLASTMLFYAISGRKEAIIPADDDPAITRLGLDPETCRMFHRESVKYIREYNK